MVHRGSCNPSDKYCCTEGYSSVCPRSCNRRVKGSSGDTFCSAGNEESKLDGAAQVFWFLFFITFIGSLLVILYYVCCQDDHRAYHDGSPPMCCCCLYETIAASSDEAAASEQKKSDDESPMDPTDHKDTTGNGDEEEVDSAHETTTRN
jgi:hypothetical protein